MNDRLSPAWLTLCWRTAPDPFRQQLAVQCATWSVPMFRIGLDLKQEEVTGLKALDKRRTLGLSDGIRIRTLDSKFIGCEVDEGFARAHFNDIDTSVRRVVTLDMLVRGDVCASGDDGRYVELADGISPERIKELWIAAGIMSQRGACRDE